MATAPAVAEALDEVRGVGRRALLVDLTALDFIDSSGIRVLAASAMRARRRGARMVVARAPGPVLRAFEIMGMDFEVECVDSLESIQALRPASRKGNWDDDEDRRSPSSAAA